MIAKVNVAVLLLTASLLHAEPAGITPAAQRQLEEAGVDLQWIDDFSRLVVETDVRTSVSPAAIALVLRTLESAPETAADLDPENVLLMIVDTDTRLRIGEAPQHLRIRIAQQITAFRGGSAQPSPSATGRSRLRAAADDRAQRLIEQRGRDKSASDGPGSAGSPGGGTLQREPRN